jgi:hypothetical protein
MADQRGVKEEYMDTEVDRFLHVVEKQVQVLFTDSMKKELKSSAENSDQFKERGEGAVEQSSRERLEWARKT